LSALAPARASRVQLLRAFHGPVLEAFSDQVLVLVPGRDDMRTRCTKEFWKLYLTKQFLGPQFTEEGELIDPPSLKNVPDDGIRLFLHAVTAFGVMDHNVVFPEKEG
jgi:hypothetical protein